MAEKLCTLRTKGGGGAKQTETVLWTNPSPSSNFASQTITLSDNMTNYDYLKVTYINATGSTATNSDIVQVSNFVNTGTQTIRNAIGATGTTGGTSRDFARNYQYNANNKVTFSSACALNYAALENNRIIPIQIVGIKVALPPSVGNVKTGTFTIAGGVTDTIICGFRPKKIYIYNLESTSKMFADIYDENVSSTHIIGAYRSSSSTNNCSSYAIGGGNNGVIQSITDTGFIFKGSAVMNTLYYTAIG